MCAFDAVTGRWIKVQRPSILCGSRASTCIGRVHNCILGQFGNIGDTRIFYAPQFIRIMFRIRDESGLGIASKVVPGLNVLFA